VIDRSSQVRVATIDLLSQSPLDQKTIRRFFQSQIILPLIFHLLSSFFLLSLTTEPLSIIDEVDDRVERGGERRNRRERQDC
jgi:hypothetical protein